MHKKGKKLIFRAWITVNGKRLFFFLTILDCSSIKVENLVHAVSLHFMYYNFCRIHKTLRVTPAMEAKITDKLWDIEDIVKLID